MTQQERCHRLIARFYEMPVHEMGAGLTIVSLPGWMDAKDIDLIKQALKRVADGKQDDANGQSAGDRT